MTWNLGTPKILECSVKMMICGYVANSFSVFCDSQLQGILTYCYRFWSITLWFRRVWVTQKHNRYKNCLMFTYYLPFLPYCSTVLWIGSKSCPFLNFWSSLLSFLDCNNFLLLGMCRPKMGFFLRQCTRE